MKLHKITLAFATATFTTVFSGSTSCAQAVSPNPNGAINPRSSSPVIAADYGKLPLSFVANMGQTDPRVRFTSRGSGYSLFLTDKEAVLSLGKGGAKPAGAPFKPVVGLSGSSTSSGALHLSNGNVEDKTAPKTDIIRMQLAGAKSEPKVSGEEQLPGTANYFIGKDPAKWHSNIPTYAKVKYSSVYPGVDLLYYGNQRQLEYDFVVAPGANPGQVKLHFAGADKLKLDSGGNLTIIARNGEISFHKPVVYQLKNSQLADESASRREPVEGKFTLLADNTIGFKLGAYDKSRTVVIDPTLAYSTYLGGSGVGEFANAIAVDAYGNAYVTGGTGSADFPVTPGAFQSGNTWASQGATNVFVSKISSTGGYLIYSTFLGGSVQLNDEQYEPPIGDVGAGIAVDASGNAYVGGTTGSADFPVTNGAFCSFIVGNDSSGFVTKLSADGSSLIYSTYLGGDNDTQYVGGDSLNGIAIDAAGDAYVTGTTSSLHFPVTPGAFQTGIGSAYYWPMNGSNAFVSKLNPEGSGLIYSTYLGGYANPTGDGGTGIAVDASGNAYVTGGAGSINFPVTAGAFQTTLHGSTGDAFVAKLNATGTELIYSTYLGGTGTDLAATIAVDSSQNAYVTGVTTSTDFPVTPSAFQKINNAAKIQGRNAFVTKLNPQGTGLLYSTYLGGSFEDQGYGIAVDASGNAYVAGWAYSHDFPVTSGAFQTVNNGAQGGGNAFLAKLSAWGTSLTYSTYLGGSYSDGAGGIALDRSGSPYVVGAAGSYDFPVTANAFQKVNNANGLSTAFVTRFVNGPAWTSTQITSDLNPATVGEKVTFTAYVSPVVGKITPTGSITFRISDKQRAIVPLDDTGHASFSINFLLAYKHWVQVIYSGDTHYAASYTGMAETVNPQN